MGLKEELRTTPRYVEILASNRIQTLKDFFNHFPRAYEDRSHIKPLNELIFDEKGKTATKGMIVQKKMFRRGAKMFYDIKFEDQNGNIGYISIFNSGFLASKLVEKSWYIIVGKPQFKYGKIIFSHPDVVPTVAPETLISKSIEDLETPPFPSHDSVETSFSKEVLGNTSYNSGRIFPIYSEMQGIKPGWFAQKIWNNLYKVDQLFDEYLPAEFVKKFGLLDVVSTIKNLHYPESEEMKSKALYRLFFDRLLRIQLFSLMNKLAYQGSLDEIPLSEHPHREILKPILDQLSFSLTVAQKKVIIQILEDFHKGRPMMRLLQGDVGSGKTIVATIAAYYIWQMYHGQSVLLAPLEVLANQHYKTLAKILLPLGLRVELLTGSLTKGQKDAIKLGLKEGRIDVLVATHAVLQDDVDFADLRFVCIDEQHKFGVKQRAMFKKFNSPHILQMTATPIPRSMALAFFGEFDVSIIDELPAGRIPIDTKVISESEYLKLKPWILQKIEQGQRVFVVTPLIEESEKMDDVKSATMEYQHVLEYFSELGEEKIGLLHGRMSAKEKDQVMSDFKNGKKCLLVSTTVIEVGVDVPEATIMIIKNAERFGLSQLHQLRGRIGRSTIKSYCFLETPKKSGDSYQRLKIMETTTDGFKLAELDLQNRGSGEILGTMQSGMSDIPLEVMSDLRFLEKIQEGAMWLLKKHPNLEGLSGLQKFMNEKIGDVLA